MELASVKPADIEARYLGPSMSTQGADRPTGACDMSPNTSSSVAYGRCLRSNRGKWRSDVFSSGQGSKTPMKASA
jgi:hypothetical protein